MHVPRRIVLASAWVGIFALAAAAETHTWTDSTGKYKTEAEFVSLVDGKVTLLRKDGKEVKLPLSRLSADDQALARELSRRPTTTAPTPSASAQPPANNFINSVRAAPYRTATLQNMRQIALALANYEGARGRFPPAALMTSDGKPGLSWRVALLPYLEEKNLYGQFKLNEPWDSPHNQELIGRMPSIYQSPGTSTDRGHTNYLAVRSRSSVIAEGTRGVRLREIRDGTSKTITFVEVDDDHAAIWTKPDDYQWTPENPMAGLGHIWNGQFFAALADGRAQSIPSTTPAETLRAMFTRNGGELVRLPP